MPADRPSSLATIATLSRSCMRMVSGDCCAELDICKRFWWLRFKRVSTLCDATRQRNFLHIYPFQIVNATSGPPVHRPGSPKRFLGGAHSGFRGFGIGTTRIRSGEQIIETSRRGRSSRQAIREHELLAKRKPYCSGKVELAPG